MIRFAAQIAFFTRVGAAAGAAARPLAIRLARRPLTTGLAGSGAFSSKYAPPVPLPFGGAGVLVDVPPVGTGVSAAATAGSDMPRHSVSVSRVVPRTVNLFRRPPGLA